MGVVLSDAMMPEAVGLDDDRRPLEWRDFLGQETVTGRWLKNLKSFLNRRIAFFCQ